ncbi:hypothetical protein M8J77_000600 [Diaphorina citri]|nr:hypothetical protein M8J77_000600 [Diaphorina citri]
MSTRDFLQWISVRCLSESIFSPRMTIPECQAACRLPDHLQTTRPSAECSGTSIHCTLPQSFRITASGITVMVAIQL